MGFESTKKKHGQEESAGDGPGVKSIDQKGFLYF